MRYLTILIMVVLAVVPGDGFSQGMDAVYAVGDDCTILKLEYGLWVPVDPGVVVGCYNFKQVWGSSEDDIYVTGCTNALLHYDGVEWQGMTIPAADPGNVEQLLAVGGTAHDNVFVGGLIDYGFSYERVAYHYDGAEWTSISDGTGIMIGIYKIWASPAGGLYATGSYYDHLTFQDYDRVIRYFDGTWSVELSESQDWDQDFIGIDGAAPSVPFVAGNWYEFYGGYGGGIWAKYGSSWSTITQSQDVSCGMYSSYCPVWPVDWYGVYCISLDDVWVVGEEGRVLHWTPSGYTEYNTPGMNALRAIWGSSNSDMYAVGDGGKIFHFDGGTWSEMASGTTENLKAIWGVSELPVATLLQEFSTDAGVSGVTIRWTLSEIDYGVWFRVLKSKGESGAFVIDDGAGIERDWLSFKYVDADVEAGGSYRYIVEYSGGEEWTRLFETSQINMPGAAFGIKSNFPNPFNPSTKITYSIPESGHVSLKIYDVSGKLVRTIVDEVQSPGEQNVQWDGVNDKGESVVSGTYFCRLISGKQAETRKLLLMR